MVPASLARKFPNANVIDQGNWGGFRRPKILLSSDPLFAHLATIYYEEIKKLYGPVCFYGGDLFHEGGVTAGLDLASLGHGVEQSMLQANPGAVWVLQGWQGNPKQELLNGLSRSHVLILNMESDDWEKRKGFGGLPWVWGLINNFGENTGMFGDLPRIASEPIRASNGPYGSSMVGLGALMEGIDNNPIVYDLLFDVAWRNEPVNLDNWLHEYVRYRYGETTPELDRAWQLLLETVYKSGSRAESIFCARPSLAVKGVSTWGTVQVDYDASKLEQAAHDFLQARNLLRSNDAYQHDAVDLARQVLANRGAMAYRHMVDAYQGHDKLTFDRTSQEFLNLLRTQDALLRTRREFMLGTWLAEAKAMAHTEEERALCEKNARTQVTYWGPDDPATELHEYASKEWSGLLQDFYLARWEMFVRELQLRLDGASAPRTNYFDFEKRWTEERKTYPLMPSGDPAETALRALEGFSNIPQLDDSHTKKQFP
jgi:alpha-N-acetylglucosaminidase